MPMSEAAKKEKIVKLPYTTPKLVEYGSVTKLTEAKSAGGTDGAPGVHHNV
jgi:hypothetical protein